ncbi:hypothetical protein OHT77_03440 [Streptomyces sp. NBC_00252]|uniref:hypothetical protein n=1 Tax=Streptomyces sp. NBC_00252 TaxID=2975691 RepID=UPI002E2A9714|nr:hypothetical protein [Streptomyces sp. NBC_00252]
MTFPVTCRLPFTRPLTAAANSRTRTDGLVSTLAYPYSPPEIDRGALYRFTLNHVATGVTPTELFRTTIEEL